MGSNLQFLWLRYPPPLTNSRHGKKPVQGTRGDALLSAEGTQTMQKACHKRLNAQLLPLNRLYAGSASFVLLGLIAKKKKKENRKTSNFRVEMGPHKPACQFLPNLGILGRILGMRTCRAKGIRGRLWGMWRITFPTYFTSTFEGGNLGTYKYRLLTPCFGPKSSSLISIDRSPLRALPLIS